MMNGRHCSQSSILMAPRHKIDVIMNAMASQIAGVSMVCSIAYSGEDQRKHQSSASLALGALALEALGMLN